MGDNAHMPNHLSHPSSLAPYSFFPLVFSLPGEESIFRPGGGGYMTNIPRLRAVMQDATRSVCIQSLAVVYWRYTNPRGALLLL
jgi:hypothetical protein